MKSRWSGVWAIAGVLAIGLVCAWTAQRTPRAGGPCASEVYLWQRSWSDPVRDALREHGGEFGRVVVLGRQIRWQDGQPEVIRVAVDWDLLRHMGGEVGGAVRIGKYTGDFEAASPLIVGTACELAEEARAHGVVLAEVQLDFDAATSQLVGYRTWVRACGEHAGVPVTITALPTWLGSRDFAPLAKEAGQTGGARGGYVLQVHGLDRPRTRSDVGPLCDPAAARRAVDRAGRLGVPFRVALPTYGYVLAFETATGQFLGLSAEDATPGWGEGKDLRVVEAQAGELAELVRGWRADRPAAMRGILWYRLPVAGDRLNWNWPTLAAVRAGRAPAEGQLEAALVDRGGGLFDVQLANTGEQALEAARRVRVGWKGGALVSSDGLAGFQAANADNALSLTGPGGWETRLQPGEKRIVGWLRLSGAEGAEVKADVE